MEDNKEKVFRDPLDLFVEQKGKLLSFQQLIEFGKAKSDNIVNGEPWSFEYEGIAVTHENSDHYIISKGEKQLSLHPDNVLFIPETGDIAIISVSELVNLVEHLKEGLSIMFSETEEDDC